MLLSGSSYKRKCLFKGPQHPDRAKYAWKSRPVLIQRRFYFGDIKGQSPGIPWQVSSLICSRPAQASSGAGEGIEMYRHHGFHEVH